MSPCSYQYPMQSTPRANLFVFNATNLPLMFSKHSQAFYSALCSHGKVSTISTWALRFGAQMRTRSSSIPRTAQRYARSSARRYIYSPSYQRIQCRPCTCRSPSRGGPISNYFPDDLSEMNEQADLLWRPGPTPARRNALRL